MKNLSTGVPEPPVIKSMEDILVSIDQSKEDMQYILTELRDLSEQATMYTTLGLLINSAEESNVSDKFVSQYGQSLVSTFNGLDLNNSEEVISTLKVAQEGIISSIGQTLKDIIAKTKRGFAKMFTSISSIIDKTNDEVSKLSGKEISDISDVVVLGMKRESLDKFLKFDFIGAAEQTNKRILKFKIDDLENTAKIKTLTKEVASAMVLHRVKRSKVKLGKLGFNTLDDVNSLFASLNDVHGKYDKVDELNRVMESHLMILEESMGSSTTTTTTTTHKDKNNDRTGQSETSSSTETVNPAIAAIYHQLADTWYRFFTNHVEVSMQVLDTYRGINKAFK